MKSQTLLLVIALYIIYRLATRATSTTPPPDTEPRAQAAPTAKVLPGPGGLQADIERAAS